MTTCTAPFDRLNAYVDGELLAGEELEVRRHLDVCAICAARVESLLAVKDAVAASAELRPVPHTLRERLAAHAGASSRWGPFRVARLALLAAAAVLAVVIAGDRRAPAPASSMRAPRGGNDHVIEALVADHLHFLEEPGAVEIGSNDPDGLAAALGAKVGFPVAIPRLKDAALLGGRLCSLWGQKVALAFYEAHGKHLSLFIADRARFPSPVAQGSRCTAAIGDYRVCLLPAGETVLAMVGDGEQTAAMFGVLEDAVGARGRSELE
jgi:anti-sigma factor RsiW